jgi:hypothetical protein
VPAKAAPRRRESLARRKERLAKDLARLRPVTDLMALVDAQAPARPGARRRVIAFDGGYPDTGEKHTPGGCRLPRRR